MKTMGDYIHFMGACLLILTLVGNSASTHSRRTSKQIDNTVDQNTKNSHNCSINDVILPQSSSLNCSVFMKQDRAAYFACLTEDSLQKNWFPSPESKCFSYQRWNGLAFWQNGLILESLVNFMIYANHTHYSNVVKSSYRDLNQLLRAYLLEPSYDDLAWYALSYLRAYELFNDEKFLTVAHQIYAWNWKNGWDATVCGGGMWFDFTKTFKGTITNALMFNLGAKLYIQTGSKDIQLYQQVQLTWQWINKSKIIDPITYSVYDGISLNTCVAVPNDVWTYNAGVLIGGLVTWSNITTQDKYLDIAHKLADSVRSNLTKDNVLTETCDKTRSCNNDQVVFKGIFARNLRYLMEVSPRETRDKYQRWLDMNIAAVMLKDICLTNCTLVFDDGPSGRNFTYPVFDSAWGGPFNHSSPREQMSVLDLLVSAIRPTTTHIEH